MTTYETKTDFQKIAATIAKAYLQEKGMLGVEGSCYDLRAFEYRDGHKTILKLDQLCRQFQYEVIEDEELKAALFAANILGIKRVEQGVDFVIDLLNH